MLSIQDKIKMYIIGNTITVMMVVLPICLLSETGTLMRVMAMDIVIKDIRNNKTYANGLLHSFDDSPALINSYGDSEWYVNGKLHSANGYQAVTYLYGYQVFALQ